MSCELCGLSLDNERLYDSDSNKHAHIHCFFNLQKHLECGSAEYVDLIKQNPLNLKWYIYRMDDEYKHFRTPLKHCPNCGKELDQHE